MSLKEKVSHLVASHQLFLYPIEKVRGAIELGITLKEGQDVITFFDSDPNRLVVMTQEAPNCPLVAEFWRLD